jgi:hypothetical protein
MLNRITALLLIFCSLSANFSMLYIYAGYQVNQKYIASTLCENRDKPWLHCNGRCVLMKKIKAAEEKERSEESQTQKSLLQVSVFEVAHDLKFHNILLQVLDTPYRDSYRSVTGTDFFQPPRLG